MAKAKQSSIKSFLKNRHTVQFLATLISNPHIPNFFKGSLYQGKAKALCVPGLNCYSCPAATGSCPIGSFQAVVGSSKFHFSYYVTGILIFLGMVLGRFICGFLCPFGWFQELLHKIPGKKFSTKKLKPLRFIKYGVLALFVIILPIFWVNEAGISFPYFCKYICPQGVLEGGIPLAIVNPDIRRALGVLFSWKTGVLAAVVLLSILFYRPFCKWLCPLGAFYALFNKISLLHYRVDEDKCIQCGKCSKACQMDVDITEDTGHAECIRCGDCKRVCPTQAISVHWGLDKKTGGKKHESSTENKSDAAGLDLGSGTGGL
jgi:ferredoxin-type protein NapH